MENNNDFIKDWLEGKISQEELLKKKKEGDSTVQAFDELITRTSGMKVPEKVTKEEAWQKFSAKVTAEIKPEAKVVKLNRWIPISIAASITLIVASFFVFGKTTVVTQMAETKVYILPDGSEVTLNADSKITFSEFSFSGNRNVSLEGEAFFEVTKGNMFTVASENGTVTVLGTSFNVNTRPSAFEVSCFTGKVKVNSGVKEVVLTRGLSTKLKQNELSDATSFDDKKSTWRDGDFYFEAQPLTAVIDELERQFGFEITYTGDTTRLYSGYFSRKNADEALEMVFKPMSLTYRRDGNKIIVR